MGTSYTIYNRMPDEQLFNLVKEDNRRAFEELYNRYWFLLLEQACKPLQSKERAQDIVQEIFISLYQRRKSIELSVSLKAYLCKALKFKVLNEFRARLVRNIYQQAVCAEGKTDFASPVETKELEQAINRSVGRLPEKCRKAFLLSRQENLSYKDISGELDISVSTVEKHISKALKLIRFQLNC
ncbi:MAG: RNA polymerase sigma-70 factor [Williamsia sp.]|nr:RNA polymerase sigma-70 factor [Williamsia sp.]